MSCVHDPHHLPPKNDRALAPNPPLIIWPDLELTWTTIHVLGARRFVAPAGFAHQLVASGEHDYADEGEEEGEGGGDVPLSEDDAQVCRVPGEEHLGIGVSNA